MKLALMTSCLLKGNNNQQLLGKCCAKYGIKVPLKFSLQVTGTISPLPIAKGGKRLLQ